jgi:hypothetical protein
MVRTHRGSRSENRKRVEDTVRTLVVHNELPLVMLSHFVHLWLFSRKRCCRLCKVVIETAPSLLSANKKGFDGCAEETVHFAKVAVNCVQQNNRSRRGQRRRIEHCQLRLRSLSEELKQMLLRSRQKLKATVEVFWPK